MNTNSRPQPMFIEDDFGKGMTKEQRERVACNLWVSIHEAKERGAIIRGSVGSNPTKE